MEKTKVVIVGYGNIGHYALRAVEAAEDMELVGVVRHNAGAQQPKELAGIPVVDDVDKLPVKPQVALLCLPTRSVEENAKLYLAKGINTVDSFDIHTQIWELHWALDKAAKEIGVDFLGGYSALVHKAMNNAEREFLESIPEAISTTDKICSSVNVASTRSGINMDAVALMGRVVKELAERTADRDAIGCAKFVVFANAVEDNPFMAGAFTGLGEGEATVNVGVSGPGVVAAALKACKGADLTTVAEVIKKTAFKITRAGQLVGEEAARLMGAKFGIVDLSLAPTPAIGDSVAEILEVMGLSSVGGHGTTAALAMLNDAVKKGGVMASGMVGGLSGAFIPVSEDAGMIRAVRNGKLSISKLEAMTSVCSVGLDMIAVPGDTTAETISAIIADECAIGVVNNKTTAVRLIPVPGKGVGDEVCFGGLLGSAPIMPVSDVDSSEFVLRGGIIPAPLHSLKN